MTKEYTTVVYEEYLNVAGVFFGERLAYIVKKPNKVFFEDLNKMNMKSVQECKKHDNDNYTKEDEDSWDGI